MSLVLDTGVLVAAVAPRDADHATCARFLASSQERRVVPGPVLVEVDYLLRSSSAWLSLLGDVLSGAIVVAELGAQEYRRVDQLMRTYADLRVGYVDCAVLAVVERLGETKLATLDRRHFARMRPAHVDALELVPHL